MNTDRVSVVIPAYRAGGTIRRAIDSVLAQSYSAVEVIIIDDGDRDDISRVLGDYPSKVSLIRKTNGGAASARNAGLDVAKGDVIAFLDADDYWEPQKLMRHLDILNRYKEVGLTCSRYHVESPTGRRMATMPAVGTIYDTVLTLAGEAAFSLATQTSTITVVARRTTIGAHRFPERLKTGEDRHLWMRLISSVPVYFLSEPLATAVEEPESLSRSDVVGDCVNMLRVIREFRDAIGSDGVRKWEAITYRRWAGACLAGGMSVAAFRGALLRLCREPTSPEGWWILTKSVLQAVGGNVVTRRSVVPLNSEIDSEGVG